MTEQGAPPETAHPPRALKALMSPWLRYFVAYDPRPALEKLRCPVLAVNGSKDLQVPPKENLAGIKAALHADPDATVIELPGLNHLLQTADTGQVSEYGKIEETISPLALRTVSDWIVAHTR